MSFIRIYVTLKIPDNIARTAFHAIQNRLGVREVESLRRSEFWELSFPGLTPEQALATVNELVTKTALFVNPNKHRWILQESERSLEEDDNIGIPESVSASVLVCDRIDGQAESVLESLERLPGGRPCPAGLIRGIWWDITYTDLPPDRIRRTTEQLTVTNSRTQGLLANPHYQTYRIFTP